jgi:adenylosuccinate lyase
MSAAINKIDYAFAAEEERRVRHDVMAHVRTFAKECPSAAGVIHLGATSAFVQDNAELMGIRSALELLCVGL